MSDIDLPSNNQSTNTVHCSNCGTPFQISYHSVNFMEFPQHAEKVVDLIAHRLNVHNCPACDEPVTAEIPVLALHEDRQRCIVVVPDEIADSTRHQLSALTAELGHEMQLVVCSTYDEFYQAVCVWVNEVIVPFTQTLLAVTQSDRRIDPEEITPLILLMFQGQANGTIPRFLQMQRHGEAFDGTSLLRDLFIGLVTDLLTHLRRTAIARKEVARLEDIYRERVPISCIVPEVLEWSLEQCHAALVPPLEDPTTFGQGFLREYSNAVLYVCCSQENPRSDAWAGYLRLCWWLSKREDVMMDPLFSLPPEVIRRTVRFSDLWNVYGKDPVDDLQAAQQHMSDRHDMLAAYGLAAESEQSMRSGMMRISSTSTDPDESASLMDALGDEVLTQTRTQCPLNQSRDVSEMYGYAFGQHIRIMAKNGMVQTAKRIALRALEQAIEAEDAYAAYATALAAIEALNHFAEHASAVEFAVPILDNQEALTQRFHDLPSLIAIQVSFFNETGNTLRYLRHFDAALSNYQISEKLLECLPDEEEKVRRGAVLKRNRAIVYRESGQYGHANKLFTELLATSPDDPLLLHSTAILAFETGDFERGLVSINHVIELTAHRVLPEDRAVYLIARAMFRIAQKDHDGAMDDLVEAVNGTHDKAAHQASRAASAVVRNYSTCGKYADIVWKCMEYLESHLDYGAATAEMSEAELQRELQSKCMIAVTLGERYLDDGIDITTESPLQQALNDLIGYYDRLPYQYHLLQSRVFYKAAKYDLAARFLSNALLLMDERIPRGEQAEFALGSMHQHREHQQTAGKLAVDLARLGYLEDNDLINVYEFMNGREISAGLDRSTESIPHPDRVAQKLADLSRKIVLCWFLDSGDEVRLACISSGETTARLLEDVQFNRTNIEAVKTHLRSVLNALDPRSLTQDMPRLREWNELATTIGRAISPLLQPDCEIWFLPGRTFNGLPLHLVTLPHGRALIEDHPVGYSSNFSTLLAEREHKLENTLSGLVAVTKSGDQPAFKERIEQATQDLMGLLGHERCLTLSDTAADHNSVLDLMSKTREFVFLCHGADGGLGKGAAICIANQGELPPSLFAIQKAPELRRFLIFWDDFARLKTTPELVMSIACSSGLTVIGPAGERFGLEQSLFARGTRWIISPLWDVDQGIALKWIVAFVRITKSASDVSHVQSYRLACLQLRDELFDLHPTAWGPFMLNGSLIE